MMKNYNKRPFFNLMKSTCVFAGLMLMGITNTHAQDFPEPYCDIAFEEAIEPVTLVQFAGIDNETDAEVDGTPALEDFTDQVGEVSPGSLYTITLDGNTDGEWYDYFYVYIDWNQDDDFEDDNEAYSIGSIYDSEGYGTDPAIGNILVPTTALAGNTRMRVLKIYDEASDPGPCSETYSYGQAEDYTLDVAAVSCSFPEVAYTIVPDCDAGEFSVDIELTDLGDASSVVLKEGEDELHTFSATGTYTAGPFTSGSGHTFTFVHSGDEDCNMSSPVQTYECPLSNDECSDAIALTVNADLDCGTVTSATTQDATESLEGCSGTADDDVWFSFEAAAEEHIVSLSNIEAVEGFSTDMMFEVFDGCGGESLLCSDPEEGTVSGLTIGNTYYIRVYSYGSSSRETFDICIGTLPGAPGNDECSGAISLTVNEDAACGSVTSGTTAGATESLEGCSGIADDDVWFSFEATAAVHTIALNDITGSTDDMMFEVFDGCGGESLLCSDPESATLAGLTSGNTYYVRVYTYSDEEYASFDICIGSIPTGGSCDDPLTITSVPYTTDGNTADYGNYYEGSPGSSCTDDDYLDGDDAVYAYTPDEDGSINVELLPDDEWAGIFIYTSCDDIGVSCADGGVNEDSTDPINIDDFAVTGGTTYYFVISTWPSPESTGYTLNITEGASCVAPDDLSAGGFTASSADASWVSTGTEFELEWGETGFDLGSGTVVTGITATSYTIESLDESTTYDFYVKRICGAADESEWAGPFTFTVPGPGWTCGNPLEVTTLPYSTEDNTADYGNDYAGSPGGSCSEYDYLDGYDVVYAYAPETDGSIDVELLPEDEWAGIFIYTDCDDIGVSCTDGGVNEDSTDPINIDDFAVTGGTTYYFVISTWPDPESTGYTLNISESSISVTGVIVGTEGDIAPEINVDDGTLQMTAAVTPAEADQSVTWSMVPGTGTATVSATGLVTALTNGTVWAKAVSVADAAYADSMEITITNQVQPVASVDVSVADGEDPEITVSAGTLQMIATVLPADADPSVTWSIIPETGSATISATGLITASGNGTVWAKAVAVADVSKSDSLMITITNQGVGIEAVIKALGLSLHPNPARDAIYLQVQNEHPALSVSLTDINGRLINIYEVKANGLQVPLKIDLSALSAGMYMLNITGEGINIANKLIKN